MRLEAPDHKHFVGIVIVTCSEWQRYANIKEIMYGIEEEQVPFEIWKEFHKAEDIVHTAYKAAIRSAFDVGMCCATNGIVIHHRKLKKQNPLFYFLNQHCNPKDARTLGINAARLVKGKPFAEI